MELASFRPGPRIFYKDERNHLRFPIMGEISLKASLNILAHDVIN